MFVCLYVSSSESTQELREKAEAMLSSTSGGGHALTVNIFGQLFLK